ncbi:MAG TPA: alpha/beta fold hydrolase [Opitutaceae bacterium]|jgi:pimeloyl-ACP methyl ester carboxylesterase
MDPEAPNVVALAHRDLGGSGSPAIVLLHGLLGSSRNWQTAGRGLATRRRVFALDLRNHGMSPHSPGMSYGAMAGDVLAWLEAHVHGPVELVGHSMGGKVAMLIACRHPARVSGLAVIDIAPRPYRWPERRQEFAAMNDLDLSTLTSRADAEARMEARVPDWAQRKFLTTNLERAGDGWAWQIDLPAITASIPGLEANPIADGERFDGPCLFLTGEKSGYVRPADHAAIRRHFPSARIEVLAGSGHNPHMEAREAFLGAIARWEDGQGA